MWRLVVHTLRFHPMGETAARVPVNLKPSNVMKRKSCRTRFIRAGSFSPFQTPESVRHSIIDTETPRGNDSRFNHRSARASNSSPEYSIPGAGFGILM